MLTVKYPSKNSFRVRAKRSYFILGRPKNKVKVDIVVPGNSEDIDKSKIVAKNRDEPFLVPGPGEYEVSGTQICGSGDGYWEIGDEEWRICFISGDWQEPNAKKVDHLGQLDLLFLSLTGGKKEAKKAKETVKRLSPRGIVFGYGVGNDFLDKIDREDIKPVEKVKIKQADLTEEGTDYFALKS